MKKLRIGFTIIFNGMHHLLHNNYAEYLLSEIFDYWIIVEGATLPNGSTKWVKGSNYMNEYHFEGHSIDGTLQYLIELKKKYSNLIVLYKDKELYRSKDEMVNIAIDEIRKITNDCYLWEIDIDEQWELKNIESAEQQLAKAKCKMGMFYANHLVGVNLIAKGPNWGGNLFHRLWQWNGENFYTHEPPELDTDNKTRIILDQTFNHYSYYYDFDVEFKAKWYYNDINIYNNWKKLQSETKFPKLVKYFLPIKDYGDTPIIKKEIKEIEFNGRYSLLVPYFIHKLESRNIEFLKCLKNNIENIYIKKIYLFFENYDDTKTYDELLKHKKVKIINTNKRQTYKIFMDYINKYLINEVCIIANADIWFDKTILNIEKFNLNNRILCLTRYNNIDNYSDQHIIKSIGCSHDAWVFKSPIKKFNTDIQLGILGCDSYFHVQALKAGLELLNPSYDIKSYHEHSDKDHNSKTRNNKLPNGKTYGQADDWFNYLLPAKKYLN